MGMGPEWMDSMVADWLKLFISGNHKVHSIRSTAGEVSLNEGILNQSALAYSEVMEVVGKSVPAKIIFIGHSLGGLTAALTMKKLKETSNKDVKALFTIASPFEGAPLVFLRGNKLLTVLVKRFAGNDPLVSNCIKGTDCIRDLEPGSDVLKQVIKALKEMPNCLKIAIGIKSTDTAKFLRLPPFVSSILDIFISKKHNDKSSDGFIPLESQLAHNSGLGINHNFFSEICVGDFTHKDANHPIIQKVVKEYFRKFELI